MKAIIVAIVITVLAIGWLKWKVATMALIYYMEKSQYKQPDKSDMEECTGFVVKNMLKDLTGR